MNILDQTPLRLAVCSMTSMHDEIFTLSGPQGGIFGITVYDRNNLSEVKDVIQLPGLYPVSIAACSVSNSVYLLNRKMVDRYSLVRIEKDEEHPYAIKSFISDISVTNPILSISPSGSIILARRKVVAPSFVNIYSASGRLHHRVKFPRNIVCCLDIFSQSNGNLLLVSSQNNGTKLTELSLSGLVSSEVQTSVSASKCICKADSNESILIVDQDNKMKLLNFEYDLLNFTGPMLGASHLHYNIDRHEVVAVLNDLQNKNGLLSIFTCREC